jgi:hypothetical protein
MSNTQFIKTTEYIIDALRLAHPGMKSEWILFQDVKLPSEDSKITVCLSNVLIHANFGIAILDLVPGPTVSDAVFQVCRVLDDDGFAAAFGRLPPVVHLYMPMHALPEIEVALDQAFAKEPGIALKHGAAWVAVVQRRFDALPSTPIPVGMVTGEGALIRPDKIPKRYYSARPRSRGSRGLLWFWGGVLTAGSISFGVLQYLGPLTQPISETQQTAWPDAEPSRNLVAQDTQALSMPPVSEILGPTPPLSSGSVPSPEPAVMLAPIPPKVFASANITARVPRLDRDPAAADVATFYAPPMPFIDDTLDSFEVVAWQSAAAIVFDQTDLERLALMGNLPPNLAPPEPAVTLAPMPPAAVASASSMAGVLGPDRDQPGPAAAAIASYDLPAPLIADTPGSPEAVEAVKLKMTTLPSLVTTEALIRRANIMISQGDISAARLLYRRAAAGGSERAMLALGKTYDPIFLAEIGARGIVGDVAAAIVWYQRAFALGVNEAWDRLALHNIHPESPTANLCGTCQPE